MRFNKVMNMKKKGLTMIELIAVMAMIAIVGLGVMSLYLSQIRLFNNVNNETILQDEARLVLTALEDDLRVGKNTYLEDPGNLTTSITIEAVDYSVPLINGVSGRVVFGFTKSVKNPAGVVVNEVWAYILYGTELVKAKGTATGSTGTLNVTATPSKNVKDIEIIDIPSGPDMKTIEYTIKMKLEKRSESDEFISVIVKR